MHVVLWSRMSTDDLNPGWTSTKGQGLFVYIVVIVTLI